MLSLMNSLKTKSSMQDNLLISTIDSTNLHILLKLRQEIISYFQDYYLLGDSLAAEYLLMNLLSSV